MAQNLVNEVNEYLDTNVPVGKYLADQLLLPVALAGQGVFLTQTPSLHTKTNIAVIHQFMDIQFNVDEIRPGAWLVGLN